MVKRASLVQINAAGLLKKLNLAAAEHFFAEVASDSYWLSAVSFSPFAVSF